jgi:hypothetical protein
MLASFIDATVTEWAQHINLSCGWKNPDHGAHASTHTIGISEDTFSVILHGMTVDAIKASARCSD